MKKSIFAFTLMLLSHLASAEPINSADKLALSISTSIKFMQLNIDGIVGCGVAYQTYILNKDNTLYMVVGVYSILKQQDKMVQLVSAGLNKVETYEELQQLVQSTTVIRPDIVPQHIILYSAYRRTDKDPIEYQSLASYRVFEKIGSTGDLLAGFDIDSYDKYMFDHTILTKKEQAELTDRVLDIIKHPEKMKENSYPGFNRFGIVFPGGNEVLIDITYPRGIDEKTGTVTVNDVSYENAKTLKDMLDHTIYTSATNNLQERQKYGECIKYNF